MFNIIFKTTYLFLVRKIVLEENYFKLITIFKNRTIKEKYSNIVDLKNEGVKKIILLKNNKKAAITLAHENMQEIYKIIKYRV